MIDQNSCQWKESIEKKKFKRNSKKINKWNHIWDHSEFQWTEIVCWYVGILISKRTKNFNEILLKRILNLYDFFQRLSSSIESQTNEIQRMKS